MKPTAGSMDAASAPKRAPAAALLCSLADLYTRNDLEGKWRELVSVYEVSRAAFPKANLLSSCE
jgi:hypothetical protein